MLTAYHRIDRPEQLWISCKRKSTLAAHGKITEQQDPTASRPGNLVRPPGVASPFRPALSWQDAGRIYPADKSMRAAHTQQFLLANPAKISADVKDFWGGYVLSFKLIAAAKYAKFAGDSENLRRNAVQIGARGKFEIDISKFEYCVGKSAHTFDNFRIFIYTPAMIVCEKLRAICQQMPEYGPIVHRQRPGSARSRDFVDIYQVIESFQLNLTTPENRPLLRNIFDAKRVPLAFMDALPQYREFHRPDFEAVKAMVKAGHVLRDFDFYFDYAVGIWARLKALGNV